MHAIANETKRQISNFNSQNLTNIVRSFLVFDMFKSRELLETFNKEFTQRSLDEFSSFEHKQLYQISKYFELDGYHEFSFVLKKIDEKNIVESFKETTKSKLHLKVSEALRQASITFQEEYFDKATAHSIDIAFTSQKIAVEIDGPHHYVNHSHDGSISQIQSGSTILRNKMLKKAQWKLIILPYWQLDKIEDPKELKQYLIEEIFLSTFEDYSKSIENNKL